jgi:hypothetical protein
MCLNTEEVSLNFNSKFSLRILLSSFRNRLTRGLSPTVFFRFVRRSNVIDPCVNCAIDTVESNTNARVPAIFLKHSIKIFFFSFSIIKAQCHLQKEVTGDDCCSVIGNNVSIDYSPRIDVLIEYVVSFQR